jgi:hypothetical protein
LNWVHHSHLNYECLLFNLVCDSYSNSTENLTVDQILQKVLIELGLGLLPQIDLEYDYS